MPRISHDEGISWPQIEFRYRRRVGRAIRPPFPGRFMSKRRITLGLFLLLFGLVPLLNSLSNPRLEKLHGSDFVQLIAAGLCLGVGFGVLVGGRKFFDT